MDICDKIAQQKVKGYLTVKKRIIFGGGVYHVTQRAPGKELIFLEDNDYLYFLKVLKETVRKFSLNFFSFALLSNHLHLFLQITEPNLSLAMKHLFEKYATHFNKKYERKGHVFCGRFRASLCYDDMYLLAISIYIHLNPVRAGLCENFKDYRWSSIRLYLDEPKDSFIKHEKILGIIDPNTIKAREKYLELLSNGLRVKGGISMDRHTIEGIVKSFLKGIKEVLKYGDVVELDHMAAGLREKVAIRNIGDHKARKYVIEQLLANGCGIDEVLAKLNISRATYFRLKKKVSM